MSERMGDFAKTFRGIPLSVKIAEADAKALRDLNDKIKGLQAWVAAISAQGERKMAELTAEGRAIWQRLAKEYDLDLKTVNYDLNDAGDTLVPQSIRLVGPDETRNR